MFINIKCNNALFFFRKIDHFVFTQEYPAALCSVSLLVFNVINFFLLKDWQV